MFLIYQKNNVLKVTYVLSVTDRRTDGQTDRRTLYAPSGGTLLSRTVTNIGLREEVTVLHHIVVVVDMVAPAGRASRSPLLLHECYVLKCIPQCSESDVCS